MSVDGKNLAFLQVAKELIQGACRPVYGPRGSVFHALLSPLYHQSHALAALRWAASSPTRKRSRHGEIPAICRSR